MRSKNTLICIFLRFWLRLCLFWVKITSGNAFPEMRLFGWSGKFYFPKIEIRWPKKCAFDHGNAFTLLFYLQRISGKWERERERESAREEKILRDRELQLQSEIAIDGERGRFEIAPSINDDKSSPTTAPSIAFRDRDRRHDRDLAVDRAIGLELELAISDWIFSSRARSLSFSGNALKGK